MQIVIIVADAVISIHALLAESDRPIDVPQYHILISIHALLAESDKLRNPSRPGKINFYPRSPCGERHKISTVSITRENFYPRSPCGERLDSSRAANCQHHFYPRSPCGERQSEAVTTLEGGSISIHALLAESDYFFQYFFSNSRRFLSTLSLRRATSPPNFCYLDNIISIHALLAESDRPLR